MGGPSDGDGEDVEGIEVGRRRQGRPRGPRRAATAERRFTPEERARAVAAFGASGLTVGAFARDFGVSAQTVRNWRKRYGEGGAGAVVAGPRKPRGQPPLSAAVRSEIVEVRRRFPTFGLRKIRDFLARFAGLKVSTGSVRKSLRTAGAPARTAPPRVRHRKPPKVKSFERAKPGLLWQSDITYLHLRGDRRPLYLIAWVDDHSRYVVSFGLYTHMRGEIATETLLEGIARFGKPKEVLTDQGRQYFAWRGKTKFQKLLRKEGIEHAVARAHHPMTCGKCERLWQTIKEEFWDVVRPETLDDARRRLVHYLAHYNWFRPHQGIGGLVPADRFFGAENQVKEAMRAAIQENALRLAVGEAPRKPVFLVGQIGEESVSIHGEKGRVVIQTEQGERREIGMDELGMPPATVPGATKETESKETDHGRDEGRSTTGGGAYGAGGAADGAGRPAATVAPGQEAHEDRDAGARGAAREGAVAGGERGGEEGRARQGGGDPGDVAGQGDAGGGGGEAVRPPAAAVADEPDGGVGDGGGAPGAAQGAGEEGGGGAPPPGGGPELASPKDVPPREGTGGSAEPDRDPARDARAPGGGVEADPDERGWTKPSEGGGRERRER